MEPGNEVEWGTLPGGAEEMLTGRQGGTWPRAFLSAVCESTPAVAAVHQAGARVLGGARWAVSANPEALGGAERAGDGREAGRVRAEPGPG